MTSLRDSCFSRSVAVASFTMLIIGAVGSARAVDLHVNATDDHLDYLCDDDCSLRDAIWSANNVHSGADAIYLPAGRFLLSIVGVDEDQAETGDLDITEGLLIFGQGANATVIDATGLGDRVFEVRHSNPGIAVGMEALTITGGNTDGAVQSYEGGGIKGTNCTLALSGIVVASNRGEWGGGIRVSGSSLTVRDGCVIRGNVGNYGLAGSPGGGICASASTVTVTESTISENAAAGAPGGGIFALNSTVTVTDSTITANRTSEVGAGLTLISTDATISGSTISYNYWAYGTGSSYGGGLFVQDTPTSVDLANSTVFGNSASDAGGGIYVNTGGIVALHSVTIAGNEAGSGAAVYNKNQLSTVNTVISGPCQIETTAAVTSYGNNLESPLNSCGLDPEPGFPPDQVGVVDAMLSPLGHFGGPTASVLPLAGSPAIDAGSEPGAGCWPDDQRGLARPAGTGCDVGAVERQDADADPLFFDDFESGNTSEW